MLIDVKVDDEVVGQFEDNWKATPGTRQPLISLSENLEQYAVITARMRIARWPSRLRGKSEEESNGPSILNHVITNYCHS